MKTIKRNLRFIPLFLVALFVIASVTGWFFYLSIPESMGTAYAQQPMSAPYGVRNGCAGVANLASGNAKVIADCMAGFNYGPACQEVGLNGAGTPVLGDVVKCYATSTTTQYPTGSAPTATHTAIVINAATANATATVQWWAVQ